MCPADWLRSRHRRCRSTRPRCPGRLGVRGAVARDFAAVVDHVLKSERCCVEDPHAAPHLADHGPVIGWGVGGDLGIVQRGDDGDDRADAVGERGLVRDGVGTEYRAAVRVCRSVECVGVPAVVSGRWQVGAGRLVAKRIRDRVVRHDAGEEHRARAVLDASRDDQLRTGQVVRIGIGRRCDQHRTR
jgi:hypothetical protein